MKQLYRKNQKFGIWSLTHYLGGGGNGEVWACQNPKGETNAIKFLKKIKPKSYSRFVDETIAIEQNSDIKGIIPIIEKQISDKLLGQPPYFIMPLAESSEKKLKAKPIEVKVNAIIQVAETLQELHKRKIYHRDIKPANILFYESRFAIADFGLVDYPNKKDISLKNEEIGAKWTMAPEMKRESSQADIAKADIYSLAKTLWIYLTENQKGFDGQYSIESIIHLKKFYPESYTSPIDNLLIISTDNDPTKRPTIETFIHSLKDWEKLAGDYHKRNLQQWFEIQTKLFPTSIPQRVIWEDINDIVKILKVVCTYNDLNRIFFPNNGGLDMKDVRLSYEKGCIELDFGTVDIVKPKRLIFESFGDEHQWNYFRLETNELEPSGVYKEKKGEEPFEKTHSHEEVTELYPSHYVDFDILENRYDYDNINYEIPKEARNVGRYFRGSFVIFCKRSIYNLTTSTDDARHNKMTTDEFREYIQKSVDNFKNSR